jgi:hypothetical protein
VAAGVTTLATEVVHDVSLDVLEADPYPTYAWLRENQPIAWVPEAGRVFVTTWELCDQAGNDDEVFEPAKDIFNTVYGDPNVISLRGSGHREMRNALNPPFRPRAVAGYRDSHLRKVAAEYVEAVRPNGRAEASSEILEPISQRTVGDVLGFTDVDDATLSRWFKQYGAYLVDFGRSEAVAAQGRSAKAEVIAYLERRLRHRAFDDARPALDHLRRRHALALVTNGASCLQREKLAGCGLAASAAAQGNPHSTVRTSAGYPSREALDRLNLAVEWAVFLPIDGTRDSIAHAQIVDGNQMLVETRSGVILAVDMKTGQRQWSFAFPHRYATPYPAAVNSKFVFVINLAKSNCTCTFAQYLLIIL